jgi:hypothetical protein
MAQRSADKGLSFHDLGELYDELECWGEHPSYKMIDWRNAVAADDTRLGYWAWVAALIEQEEGDSEAPVPEGVIPMAILNLTTSSDPLAGMELSEDVEPGPEGTLPPFDELQYRYFAPVMENGEAEGDYYGVIGFLDGKGQFSGLVPSGGLDLLVGPTLATKMVLGQGTVVKIPNVIGEANPAKSLQVHGMDISPMDVKWLRKMGIEVPRD